MKHKTFTLKASLLGKLLLSLALFIGSADVWADETLTVYGTSASGQSMMPVSAGNLNSTDLYACGQFIIPSTAISEIDGGQITKMKFYISSGSSFQGAEFEIYVKEVDVTSFSSTDFVDWNTMTQVYSGGLTISSSEVEVVLSDPYNYNGDNLLIGFKHTKAASKSITLGWYAESTTANTALVTKTYGTPRGNSYSQKLPKMTFSYIPPMSATLSISPNENAAFGNVTSNASKVYTIYNNTGASVNIMPEVSGTDASMFSVSPSVETSILNGESQDFTVTFEWQADVDKLGEKTATITFTPDNEDDPFEIAASATAKTELVLDEDEETTITGGSKSILVKYTPSDGWNTICMPFTLYSTGLNPVNFMDDIFGEGWKAYQLAGYENGTLSFTIQSFTVSAGYAYLVYKKDPVEHPKGVLITANPTYNTPKEASSVSGAYFQGTYVRKNYVAEDNWYGVTSDGHIKKAGTGAYVKGYRAYFTGVSAPSAGAEVKMFIIGGDDIPTDVGFVKMVDADAKEVYNLAGQRIQKARKGIYIVNGKKVVIK